MLYDKLKKYDRIPFHMPGHKRNIKKLGTKLPYDLDITEVEDYDNLHSPNGIIKDIEDKAKEVYESDNCFILVNGSTVGILAGVLSVVKRGDTVLMARNCHKSVYNAVELVGAYAEYIVPEIDEYGLFKAIDTVELSNKLQSVRPKLIVITSPTYEGVKSDIEGICELAHSYNIPVLLDAAHGAHYVDYAKDADITVMSLHKTMPALTQCALAHVNGTLVSSEEFRIKLSMLETSSPSYLLLCSIEECLNFKLDYWGFINKRDQLIKNCKNLNNLKLLDYDISKLVFFTGYSNISGIELAEKLRADYNIEVEMAAKSYVVLIITPCDDFKNYKKLEKALFEIDDGLALQPFDNDYSFIIPERAVYPFEIDKKAETFLDDSVGKISAEYVWAYPPGIPLIVPGEIISYEFIKTIKDGVKNGVNIQSTYSQLPEKILTSFD